MNQRYMEYLYAELFRIRETLAILEKVPPSQRPDGYRDSLNVAHDRLIDIQQGINLYFDCHTPDEGE